MRYNVIPKIHLLSYYAVLSFSDYSNSSIPLLLILLCYYVYTCFVLSVS